MKRLVLCFLVGAVTANLRSESLTGYILAANRTQTAEILDGSTLETIARIHFDFDVERMSGAGALQLNISGYTNHICCKEYTLDLTTLKLTANPPSADRSSFGSLLVSPDGRWGASLKSFRGPALRMVDLATGAGRDLIPAGLSLPEEICGGNWAAKGAWSGDRFYLYVGCPRHPGFLWPVSPTENQLGTEVQLDAFNQMTACREPLPVQRGLVAAGADLFIYEVAGGMSRSCTADPPGGLWKIDASTGRLHDPIARDLHFSELLGQGSGSILHGVVHPHLRSANAVQLVVMDAHDGTILKSRSLEGGVLNISVATLGSVGSGDLKAISPD